MGVVDKVQVASGQVGDRENLTGRRRAEGTAQSFRQVLEETGLRFSRHAEERLLRRDISLQEGDLRRVERAVAAAERKGAVQSLVLVGKAALIINLPTRNVISAFHRDRLKDGIFTRIDSAVVVEGVADEKRIEG